MYLEKNSNMKNSIIDKRWNTYSVILIIQALYSLKAWFLWWIPGQTGTVIIFVISVFYLIYAPFLTFKENKKVYAAVLLVILFLYQAEGNLNAYMLKLMEAFAVIPLIFLKPQYQADILEKFQKVITVILTISLAFWVLHLVGINFPSTPITYGTVDRGQGLEDQYLFDNHYVFLVNQSGILRFAIELLSMRFSSIFLEPGFLAILMVFLLFVNGFKFKERRTLLYIATIIATVSLAGYLMVVFAYIAHSVQHAKRGTAGIVLLLIASFASYNFFQNFNGGRNFINEGIIERLEFDESRFILGNNRTSEDFSEQFYRFITTPDVISGIGKRKVMNMDGANVGYKPFIMSYGIVGFTLFLSFLILLARTSKNYKSFILFLLYFLFFLRGDGPIFWTSFILIYTCGLTLFNYEKESSTLLVSSRPKLR